MKKDFDLVIISSAHTPSIIKKHQQNPTPSNSTKKRKNTSSVMWLEEAHNSARGENSMWVAVITQAMMDALSKCKKAESKYQKHEAIRWLSDNSKDFIDVCLYAGLNPDYVRRKAKKTITSPTPWRAEAGTGKRYQERKKHREKQKNQKLQSSNIPAQPAQIITLLQQN